MSKNENIAAKPAQKPVVIGENKALNGGELEPFFTENTNVSNSAKPNSGLNSATVDSLVLGLKREEAEDELLDELAKAKSAQAAEVDIIYDFSDVPETQVYSEFAKYKLFKRESKREFYINGKTLESRIGLDSALFEKVKKRERKAFCVGDDIVVFYKYLSH